ncbi:cyclic peptide export ABC transporter [Flavobacterium soyae]|uniref:cyclic peptide export ABC transporter n=1 Tax=Flavobacterium soyae TaxID=2903098 RepID=UPI001E3B329F|nr:cyclic peptide export ABC transporter [Flavobacterium soyae]MCD9574051.1 cyclic peptide export ABC transporter [Flavobacterium soyae]
MIKINLNKILLLIFYSLVNTLLTLGIIYILNVAITDENFKSKNYLRITFFSFIVYSYLLNLFFQKKIIDYTYNFVYDNELILAKKLQSSSLKQLETLGTERIYGIIEEMRVFIFLPGIMTNTLNSLLMILLCIGYLFILSYKSTLVIVALIAIIAYVYFLVGKKLAKKLSILRSENDFFNKYIHDIIQGFKELKISETRKNNLYNSVSANRTGAKDLDKFLANNFNAINILSQYGLYIVFGVILFLLPAFGIIQSKEMVSFVTVLLFMSGPLNKLITMQNMYTRTRIAIKRVKSFFKEINTNEIEEQKGQMQVIDFENLQFKDCKFEHNSSFGLGPINLSINKGETIFIIGGNGSGKSTFINLLTGLYSPSSGEILLNKIPVQSNTPNYQNLLSVIFTDNYIFSQNYDNYSLKNNKEYISLLELMELDKVLTDDEESSARRKFSKGQSKRMSMIFAMLEKSPILILDEWAADQDPYFRKYFYEKLIPMFKQQGKTIIAVTHDDAYFKHADRILKFEYGKIIKDIRIEKNEFSQAILWNN